MTAPSAPIETSLIETSPSPHPPRRRWSIYGRSWSLKRRVVTAAAIVTAVIVVMIILSVVPANQTFSGWGMDRREPCEGPCPNPPPVSYGGQALVTLPSNVVITLNWQASESPIEFSVCLAGPAPPMAGGVGCMTATTGNSTLCDNHGISGTCSFSSNAMVYLFSWGGQPANGTSQRVSWSGSYSAPVLWWFD
jgi:hypothetical protein